MSGRKKKHMKSSVGQLNERMADGRTRVLRGKCNTFTTSDITCQLVIAATAAWWGRFLGPKFAVCLKVSSAVTVCCTDKVISSNRNTWSRSVCFFKNQSECTLNPERIGGERRCVSSKGWGDNRENLKQVNKRWYMKDEKLRVVLEGYEEIF
ncbi:hypothetical protein RB195_011901 [Necator americanus]|uniref:Uncharacterized protein n=1 Tax=Necator americanus TaxID=51031 RepID=A0ABR1D4M3_NECAM